MVEYKEFLTASGDTRRQERLRCVVGFSDLLLLPADAEHSDGGELVEAKSGCGHHKVREALAQLLDYAPHAKGPLDALTACSLKCRASETSTGSHGMASDAPIGWVKACSLPALHLRTRWSA